MRIFFATDLHGSELCFKKFIRARDFYGVDALFLGGDYSSKSIAICVKRRGSWSVELPSERIVLSSIEAVRRFRSDFEKSGALTAMVSDDEWKEIATDRAGQAALFERALLAQLTQWAALARDLLLNSGVSVYQIPGNDDPYYSDAVFSQPPFVPLDRRHVLIEDQLAVLGLGGSNPTPWHTVREYEDRELEAAIVNSAQSDLSHYPLILFAHPPPLSSGLDDAPALRQDLSYDMVAGVPLRTPVGSEAVRRAINNLQPILGLFGHVHEARGYNRIGRTLCVNPGSVYATGRLLGCTVTIADGKVLDFQFTEG